MQTDDPGSDAEARELEQLSAQFLAALAARDRGDLDTAEDELRAVLRAEPRLAEPRMELARILLDTDRLADAEDHAREALEQLKTGGQWVDDLPENVVLSIAHALVAEILRRKADEDDVIFGDPDTFHAMVNEAKDHFARAAELDPNETYGSYYAFFLGDLQSVVPGAASREGAGAAPRRQHGQEAPAPRVIDADGDGSEH